MLDETRASSYFLGIRNSLLIFLFSRKNIIIMRLSDPTDLMPKTGVCILLVFFSRRGPERYRNEERI